MYYLEKTKVLISGVVALQLIYVFVFRIWKSNFSHVAAQMYIKENLLNDSPILSRAKHLLRQKIYEEKRLTSH